MESVIIKLAIILVYGKVTQSLTSALSLQYYFNYFILSNIASNRMRCVFFQSSTTS